jgi:hypothetical protein
MKRMKFWGIALALVGSYAVPAAANDSDNTFPGGWSPASIPTSIFTPAGHQWSVPENIGGPIWTGAADVDYTLLTIPAPFAGCNAIYTWMSFDHSKGDLDMVVYDMLGNQLGISQGTTNTEAVYLPTTASKSVIVKVYGFNQATGDYRIYVGCQ